MVSELVELFFMVLLLFMWYVGVLEDSGLICLCKVGCICICMFECCKFVVVECWFSE